jgi:VWFA-related protein
MSRIPRWSLAVATFVALTIPLALWAQEEIDVPLIRTGVTEVVVPVTVTDSEGRFVSNLKQSDFSVWDQGFKQNIKFFTAEHNQPVVVGFLMDLSNCMKVRWKEYHETAVNMVLALMPGDAKFQGYLIGYGTQAEVMVDTTFDADKIVSKLDKITPAGGAGLHQPEAGQRRAGGAAPRCGHRGRRP